jgi:hypothetical protein
MKAELKNGSLVITIPANDAKSLPASKSGKTLIVASSGGNVATTAQVNGQPVIIGLNAYIKKAS